MFGGGYGLLAAFVSAAERDRNHRHGRGESRGRFKLFMINFTTERNIFFSFGSLFIPYMPIYKYYMRPFNT